MNTADAAAVASAAASKQYTDKQIVDIRNGETAGMNKAGPGILKTAAIAGISLYNLEIGIPLILTELSGVPVTPSPQAMGGEVVGALEEATPGLTSETSMTNVGPFSEKISVTDNFTLNSNSNAGQINLATDNALHSPSFVVDNSGQTFINPGGSGPVPVVNPAGKVTGSAFTGGSGGANKQVSTMRIMDPTPPRGKSPGYPNGYIKYENNRGQPVNPNSGNTTSQADSHYPLGGD